MTLGLAGNRSPRWRHVTVGEVITLQRGFDITKAEQSDGPYPVISSSGPSSTHSAYKVQAPGVVIGRKGSLGGVYFSEKDFWPHDTTLWVKDFHGNDPKFLYYWLQTLGLGHYDVGASNPTLNRNHVHLLSTSVPDVPIQRKIAAVLSAYDDLIENNTCRIMILEEMAQRIYREWFVDFRYPGHEMVGLVDSSLGPIPEGWSVESLRRVATVTMGQSPPSSAYNSVGDGLPFHQGVGTFGDFFPNPGSYSRIGDRQAKAGDVLVSVRAPVGRINIADMTMILGRGLCGIRTTALPRGYLLYSLKNAFREEDNMGGGTIFKSVTRKEVEEIPILCGSRSLLQRFDEIAAPALSLIQSLTNAVRTLRTCRNVLLPRLVSGEIDVEGMDIAVAETAA